MRRCNRVENAIMSLHYLTTILAICSFPRTLDKAENNKPQNQRATQTFTCLLGPQCTRVRDIPGKNQSFLRLAVFGSSVEVLEESHINEEIETFIDEPRSVSHLAAG